MHEDVKKAYRIWKYQAGLSELAVRVSSDSDNPHTEYYVGFQGVLYYSGLMHFEGFGFETESRDACAQLLKRLNVSDADLKATSYKLFTFNGENATVQIIALNMFRLEASEIQVD